MLETSFTSIKPEILDVQKAEDLIVKSFTILPGQWQRAEGEQRSQQGQEPKLEPKKVLHPALGS